MQILPPRNNAMDSMKSFNELDEALRTIGNHLPESVYTILTLILHFGNIYFENNDDGYAETLSTDSIKSAANLVAVDSEKLRDAFLKRKILFKNAQDTIILYVFIELTHRQCIVCKIITSSDVISSGKTINFQQQEHVTR